MNLRINPQPSPLYASPNSALPRSAVAHRSTHCFALAWFWCTTLCQRVTIHAMFCLSDASSCSAVAVLDSSGPCYAPAIDACLCITKALLLFAMPFHRCASQSNTLALRSALCLRCVILCLPLPMFCHAIGAVPLPRRV